MFETARRIADEVLYPAAAAVDAADRVPASHLDLLAAEGFYGLVDGPELPLVAEALAGGCLATTFVWIQHHGAVRAAAASGSPLAEPLRLGVRRAGVSLAGARPGPSSLVAHRVDGGYRLSGEAPWVTGWDLVDTLYVAARDGDSIVWALIDAVPGPALRATPLDLVAVQASRTVHLTVDGYEVPDDRVVAVTPLADHAARDAAGLRTNGSLALGVAGRCARLLGSTGLSAQVDAARAALDAGTPQSLPKARAAAAELAFRAAAALTVGTGSRGILAGEPAQRLVREATFLLVFGSRPTIKDELLKIVAQAPSANASSMSSAKIS